MMGSDRRAVRLTLVVLVLAAPPLFAAAGSAEHPPRLSEEQARQRAAAVAKEIGQPWDATATSRAAGSDWVVECQRALLRIKGDTGQVTAFLPARGMTHPPLDKPLSEEQAVMIATRAMKAFGAPADLALERVSRHDTTWFTVWRRAVDGIPYEGGGAYIPLDSTGHLLETHLRWSPAPPPTSTVVKLTKQQAVRAAKDFLKRARLPGSHDQFIEAALRVVQPNDYYGARQPKQVTAEASAATRVAWTVSFPRPVSGWLTRYRAGPRQDRRWIRDIVWIDAADAKMLGGESGPAAEPPAEAIQRVVAEQRAHTALIAGGIAAALLAAVAVGLLVRARRRSRRAAYLARRREEKAALEREG
jgi:hypothetical protein